MIMILCDACQANLIDEEFSNHKCDGINYFIDGDTLWVRDAGQWYSYDLPPKMQHPNKTPDNATLYITVHETLNMYIIQQIRT